MFLRANKGSFQGRLISQWLVKSRSRTSSIGLRYSSSSPSTVSTSGSAYFKTTRLPSVQKKLRTITGVEEATAVLEDLSTQIQQHAEVAETVARQLAPRTARDLARALSANTVDAAVRPPSKKSLQLLALSSCVPFIGFGFVDNAVMICAGDLIETQMLKVFTISTLAAAGLGNLMSDVAGVGLGGVIESFAAKLGVEAPPLSRAQLQLPAARWAQHLGSAFGVAIGCLIGMFPLLFLQTHEQKLHAHPEGGELQQTSS